jgi:hypothetical protein
MAGDAMLKNNKGRFFIILYLIIFNFKQKKFMKSIFISFNFLILFSIKTFASVVVTNIDSTLLKSSNQNLRIDVTNDGIFDITFGSLSLNGDFTVSGVTSGTEKSFIASTVVSGSVKKKATRMYNLSSVNSNSLWSAYAWLYSPTMADTLDFKDNGNQYIGGYIVSNGDSGFFWLLINLSSTKLKILKASYESNSAIPLITGIEGQNKPNSGLIDLTQHSYIFTVYPQPTKELIYVDSNFPINALALYDLSGMMKKHQTISTKNELSVDDLKSGIYLLLIISDDKTYYQKISIE